MQIPQEGVAAACNAYFEVLLLAAQQDAGQNGSACAL